MEQKTRLDELKKVLFVLFYFFFVRNNSTITENRANQYPGEGISSKVGQIAGTTTFGLHKNEPNI